MDPVVVTSPDELLAAIPHALGFQPSESLVVVPFSLSLPTARVDLPTNEPDRQVVMASLRGAYARKARPGLQMVVVAFSEDTHAADAATRHIAEGMDGLGFRVEGRLWATDHRWTEFDRGVTGVLTPTSESKMAAEAAFSGTRRPLASREALAASLVGDRNPIAAVLDTVRADICSSTPAAEQRWATSRVDQFHRGQARLSDPDAARLLIALGSTPTRDAIWETMTRESAPSDVALWTDLTRRAPDEVRAPAAALLGFSSWLRGDGARAWCALDQIPASPESYLMAMIVATALQNGVHPQAWEDAKATVDKTEVPTPDKPPVAREREWSMEPPLHRRPAPGM